MEYLPVVFPLELFATILILTLPVAIMAPKWIADGVCMGIFMVLFLVSAPTSFLFGGHADRTMVLIQLLFWNIPTAISLARTVFAAPDAHPDYETCDPRWFYNTLEFVAELYDKPAPPRTKPGTHARKPPRPDSQEQPPTQPNAQQQRQPQQRQQRRQSNGLTAEEARKLLADLDTDHDQFNRRR